MSHFIITKGDESAEAEKAHYVNVGRETDNVATEMLNESAARAKAEEDAYQARLAQERENHRAMEEDLKSTAYKELGTRDVHLNSDGSKVKVGDSDYMSTEEFKNNLR